MTGDVLELGNVTLTRRPGNGGIDVKDKGTGAMLSFEPADLPEIMTFVMAGMPRVVHIPGPIIWA